MELGVGIGEPTNSEIIVFNMMTWCQDHGEGKVIFIPCPEPLGEKSKFSSTKSRWANFSQIESRVKECEPLVWKLLLLWLSEIFGARF